MKKEENNKKKPLKNDLAKETPSFPSCGATPFFCVLLSVTTFSLLVVQPLRKETEKM